VVSRRRAAAPAVVKRLASLLIAVFVCSAFFVPAKADTGPKPSITVKAQNLPKGEVYMDLLVYRPDYDRDDALSDLWYDRWLTYPSHPKGYSFNEEMLSALRDFDVGGWHSALAGNAQPVLFGDVYCYVDSGYAEIEYSYFGTPDVFKIIVVTESGEVRVSNTVTRKAFQAVISFDYEKALSPEELSAIETTEAATAPPPIHIPDSAVESGQFGYYFKTYSLQFLETCGLTLLIEGVLLLIFKLGSKRNWVVFLVTNIATQLLFTAATAVCSFYFGLGWFEYIILLVISEIIIFAVEIPVFARLFNNNSVRRRVLYAIIANAASCALGVVLLIR
jgi:hypothetical protein